MGMGSLRAVAIAAALLPAALALPRSARAGEVERVNAAIAAAGLDWEAGETSMTRLTPEERRRRLLPSGFPGWLPPRFLMSHDRGLPRPLPLPVGERPAALDWRWHDGVNWITPIRDQGDCGSCWAFATLANVEALVSYRRSVATPILDLSEQQLLDCAIASLGCDSGGITWGPPGNYVRDTGLVPDECYPYTSGDTGTKGICSLATVPAGCREQALRADATEILSTMPSGWPWDPDDFTMDAETLEEIKTWLADRPVGVSMKVYSDLYDYRRGIYEPTPDATMDGMHAILLVGYDDAEGYWIVKNSWGPRWGEDGFFRIRYNTSSIGMYSFVYSFQEDAREPRFCDDLPADLTVHGTEPVGAAPLWIANCGGAVLHWDAALPERIEIRGAAGAVAAGAETSAGTGYLVTCTAGDTDEVAGDLTLTGALGEPVVIHVEATGCLRPPDPEPVDAGGEAAEDVAAPEDAAPEDAAINPLAPDDGCGCAVPGRSGGSFGTVFGLLGALALRRRRRGPGRRPGA